MGLVGVNPIVGVRCAPVSEALFALGSDAGLEASLSVSVGYVMPEQRYLEFVKKYPQLEQRLSQKQISSYLGITPVFLSMLRRKLANR